MTDDGIKLLTQIAEDIGCIKENQMGLTQRIERVEETLNEPGFIRGLDFLSRHCGDEEDLQEVLSKYYGYEKKISGREILIKILENYAEKMENKKRNEKQIVGAIINSGIVKIIELLCIAGIYLLHFTRS